MTIREELEEIKNFFKWIIRRVFGKVYDELSLFVISLSFILILILNKNSILDLLFLADKDFRIYIVVLGFIYGIFYSIYHVFTDKEKSENSKTWMLFFALTLQLLVAIIALSYTLIDDSASIIYPLLNFIYVFVMYKLQEYDSLKLFKVSDRDTSIIEVILATILVLVVVLISEFLLENIWIETLSIAILLGNQISSFAHKATSSILKLKI
ncbi:MAG: hypothetical protein BalsKO_20890 [Balneolaceae bacterium]